MQKSKNLNVAVRSDQFDFLKAEAKRLRTSVSKMMLIFLLDGRFDYGRLTPEQKGEA